MMSLGFALLAGFSLIVGSIHVGQKELDTKYSEKCGKQSYVVDTKEGQAVCKNGTIVKWDD